MMPLRKMVAVLRLTRQCLKQIGNFIGRARSMSLQPSHDLPQLELPSTITIETVNASVANPRLEGVLGLNQMRQGATSLCFVMQIDSDDRGGLERSIQSILRQTDPTWELLLVAGEKQSELAAQWLDIDWRIRRIDLEPDSSGLITIAEFATTEMIAPIRLGDTIDDDLVKLVMQRAQNEPNIDIIYTDEARLRADGTISEPFYKPDWSPEHLNSVNYIGRFVAIRKSLLLNMRPSSATSPEAAEYALLLDATECARRIAHIDELLYIAVDVEQRRIGGFFSTDALPEARDALECKVRRENPLAKVCSDPRTGALDVEWPVPLGVAVTLIILTGLGQRELMGRGKTVLATNFVRSIIQTSSYSGYKIIVVDDGEVPEDLAKLLAAHNHESRTYTRTGPFSFAKKANFGVNLVSDGIVFLLNDDLEVISADWIQRLAGLAARPPVGIVGARLLFEDGTIQHAGVVLGFHGSAGHIFHRTKNDGHNYAGFASLQRNFSAVTGAAMVFRKAVFDELGGFDERFAVDYNDIDFCLRSIEAGYRVVQTPAAVLYHYHNSSIKKAHDNIEEYQAFCARWSAVIDRDPYYSNHFQKRHEALPILSNPADGLPNMLEPIVEPKHLSQHAYRELLEYLEREAAETLLKMGFCWKAFLTSKTHDLTRQIGSILRLGLFDRDFYLTNYADVRTAGVDPLMHYMQAGDAEGRWPNPVFDPRFYRKQCGEACFKSTVALYHYAMVGEAAGLSPSASFNPRRYLVSNPGIAQYLDHPLTHYLWLGRPFGLSGNRKTRLPANQKVVFEKDLLPKKVDTVRLRRAANVIGPLDRVSGLGVSARGYLEAVGMSGFGPVGARAQTREFGIQKSIEGKLQFPDFFADAAVNIVHMNGDTLPFMLEHDGALFEDRYNIAVWYWELSTLRPEWQESMKVFHEFWAPTPFIARVIRRSTTKPIRLVPPYLSYLHGMMPGKRDPAHPHFVYCFDANSIVERKNPCALLDAFRQAFPKGADARLTFKITYPNRHIPDVDRLYVARDTDPRIAIIDSLLSDAELYALIASATAYVSPHRSEGLGLTVIEAMASMVPVIATPYGGVDQFVTPDTAYTIDYSMIELMGDYVPYPKGFVWADPDVESLARLLRDVAKQPDVANGRAAHARAHVLEVFASPALIDTYLGELDRIGRQLFS